jgi:Protein of unknown function (DUF2630)
MDDQELVNAIDRMVSEEQRLLHAHESEGLSAEEHARMQDLHVRLDQAWDLLRQRRARREAGLDPEDAAPRDSGTVEGYLQ